MQQATVHGVAKSQIQLSTHTIFLPLFIHSSIDGLLDCFQLLKVKVAQSCLTLCNPTDYTVHEKFQARILEWVAFPFSRGSSHPRNRTQVPAIEPMSPTLQAYFYQLSYKRSPKILEWVAYPFSSTSS